MAETTVNKFLSNEGLSYLLNKIYTSGIKGKVLSEVEFTAALRDKLNNTATTAGLNEINTRLAALEKLIDSDADGAINKFNEIVAFLDGIEDTETLAPFVEKVAGIEAGAQKNTVTSVAGKTGAVTLAKTDVGLSNVDNTADSAKPVSTAQATAIADAKKAGTDAQTALNSYKTEMTTALGNKLNADDMVEITNDEIDALLVAATA